MREKDDKWRKEDRREVGGGTIDQGGREKEEGREREEIMEEPEIEEMGRGREDVTKQERGEKRRRRGRILLERKGGR